MSLRLRLMTAAAVAVAAAVIVVVPAAYLVTRHELRHQVDVALIRRLSQGPRIRLDRPVVGPPAIGQGPRRLAGEGATFQVVNTGGTILFGFGTPIPPSSADKAAAGVPGAVRLRDATIAGAHVRVAARGIDGGLALMAASPLEAVDGTLHRLVLLLALLALGGVALAAGLGTAVARAALAPVERLTEAAERVAATQDLTATIPVHGADEIARLAQALNAMLLAVDASQRAQRRLVADASHELRTPLTSLRTNLEVLARSAHGEGLSPDEREALLRDLLEQVGEMVTLVGQLVDLDRMDVSGAERPSPVAFDEMVEVAVARAQRNSPTVTFDVSLQPTPVMGLPGELERAAANLLDNAAKWTPPGGTVHVSLADGVLRVRDHGPGIDPADAPFVFDRFYRSASARGLPGSGLGLCIVRQAAADHGGQAWIEPAPGGGTDACLRLPTLASDAALDQGRSEPDSARRSAAPTS